MHFWMLQRSAAVGEYSGSTARRVCMKSNKGGRGGVGENEPEGGFKCVRGVEVLCIDDTYSCQAPPVWFRFAKKQTYRPVNSYNNTLNGKNGSRQLNRNGVEGFSI